MLPQSAVPRAQTKIKKTKTERKTVRGFLPFFASLEPLFASHCFFFYAKSFYFRNLVSAIGFFNIKHSCRLATSRPLILFVISSRTRQLSQIDYYTNLQVSRTGHHISRIKSSFELFCALV